MLPFLILFNRGVLVDQWVDDEVTRHQFVELRVWVSIGEKCVDEFQIKSMTSGLHFLSPKIYNLNSEKKGPMHFSPLIMKPSFFFFDMYVIRSNGETNETFYRFMARHQRMFWFRDIFSRADKSYPATWRLSDSKHSTVWLSVPIYSKIGPPDHSQMLTAKQVLPQSLP